MRQQDVFKKIGTILQELNEQYDYLKTQNEQIDDLELELFAANSHFLTDHLDVLRKLNSSLVKSTPSPATQTEIPVIPENEVEAENEPLFQPYQQSAEEVRSISAELVPVVEEPSPVNDAYISKPDEEEVSEPESRFEPDFSPASVYTEAERSTEEPETDEAEENMNHERDSPTIYEQIVVNAAQPEQGGPAHQMDMSADTGQDHFGYIRAIEPETNRHELELEETDSAADDQEYPNHVETVAEALAEIEITPATVSESMPIADAETEKPLTLNERIAGQATGMTQNTATASQPVKDLKSAITLNDKMLFVGDLFNGYSLAYSEAVEILNRFNNYEDADRFLTNNYVTKNNWETKPGTKEKFYDLLKRRYA